MTRSLCCLRKKNSHSRLGITFRAKVLFLTLTALSATFAQAQSASQELQAGNNQVEAVNGGAPLTITLQDALRRAGQNDPQYRSSMTDLGLQKEDRVRARAGLLPSVNYNTSFVYTEGTGQPTICANTLTCPASRFIANNGVHEYISQGDVHQAVSLTTYADYRRSSSAAAQARAKAEIATRGLVVTVTQAYYAL